jgi:YfiH family protein
MMDICRYPEGELRLEGLANGWQVGRFAALEAVGVAHFVTTRPGPDAQETRRDPALPRRDIAQVLGLADAAFLEQVHGGDVLLCEEGGCAGCADGLVTAAEGLALVGQSDDGPLVLLADGHRRIVGLAHASWRATIAGVTPAVVGRMLALGCELRHLVACIGPSAGPCCYEVGAEVRTRAVERIGPHATSFFPLANRQPPARALSDAALSAPRLHFDLWRANACALARAGLAARAIHVAGICTLCRGDLFPGLRGEGKAAGRVVAAVGWAAPAQVRHTQDARGERQGQENGVTARDC